MNTVPEAYIPGVCNINTVEIARRKQYGYILSAVFIVLLIALLALGTDRWFRIILFMPGVLLADCFLQAKNKFCVGYGSVGQHNANEGSDTAVAVADQAAVAKDKRRARQINLQAVAIGAVLTLLALSLPQ